jgi:hypothetical protein
MICLTMSCNPHFSYMTSIIPIMSVIPACSIIQYEANLLSPQIQKKYQSQRVYDPQSVQVNPTSS